MSVRRACVLKRGDETVCFCFCAYAPPNTPLSPLELHTTHGKYGGDGLERRSGGVIGGAGSPERLRPSERPTQHNRVFSLSLKHHNPSQHPAPYTQHSTSYCLTPQSGPRAALQRVGGGPGDARNLSAEGPQRPPCRSCSQLPTWTPVRLSRRQQPAPGHPWPCPKHRGRRPPPARPTPSSPWLASA